MGRFTDELSGQLGTFLPSLIWAIILLLGGWIIATVVAFGVKNLLKRTHIDNRIASWVTGQQDNLNLPTEQWIATIVYWVILIFTLVAFLNALNLEVVSQPLNDFLQQIFQYLPRIGGAAVLLAIAWATATVVKLLVVQGLARFNLDDRLAEQTGQPIGQQTGPTTEQPIGYQTGPTTEQPLGYQTGPTTGQPIGQQTGAVAGPFVVNETIGNILYWFIFLLFVPLVLSALDLPGLLAPVEALINQFLQAIPRILTAAIILAVGWLVARIVRGIVTNLLKATQTDRIGAKVGLSTTEVGDGVTLSGLVGSVVYVLILIPSAVAALNELNIDAISGPAVLMLERILAAVPQVLMAGLVLVVFYVIGRFVSELLTSVLRSVGFDNIFGILGLPELTVPATAEVQPVLNAEGQPEVRIETATKTPSEIAGLVALVGIVLFGAITATEILQFDNLTAVVQAILRVSAQVLSGLLVFAVGLYFANLAFRLIRSMGNSQANFLAQAARVAIIILVGAMGLQQMGVATDIVNLAFGLLLGAIAVALAIAFGLGSRDIAAEQVREWLNAFKQSS
ncbi:mechanosensitive ion channel [Leptolyngbya sp. PCC 6406]|uniref:mechanosensitive ion channel n=1 Tax=Leptolyngbya sp. PCC 6406 TaxID=1173264 RepID=UPI00031A7999|nr:mechanosensitive ion channel [Leptolyngbya sp. PCC 6406]